MMMIMTIFLSQTNISFISLKDLLFYHYRVNILIQNKQQSLLLVSNENVKGGHTSSTFRRSALLHAGGRRNPLIHLPVRTRDERT